MTALGSTRWPLWVSIVLIVVGSILILAIAVALSRCWLRRRKEKSAGGALDGLNVTPTRRVTLRRGRVVPTSQHLSLTGSRFGVRQFGMLADNDSIMTGRKSPFEWWNTIMDRSQSRQDQMSQLETGSISTRPTSRATTMGGGRREFLTGTSNLTPEKTKEPVTKTWEITLPSSSPSPSPSPSPSSRSKTVNFSRSFSNRAPPSPLTQRSQLTLSRISERSPHHSMISTTNGPTQQRHSRSPRLSAIDPLDHTPLPGQVHLQQPSPTTPRKSMTQAVPVPPSSTLPPQDFPSPSSLMPHPSREASRLNSSSTPQLSIPKPAAYRTSSSNINSFYRQPNPSTHNLNPSHRESTTTLSPNGSISTLPQPRKSSSSIGPSGIIYDSQVPTADDWFTRPDLHDLPPLSLSPPTARDIHSHTALIDLNTNSQSQSQSRTGSGSGSGSGGTGAPQPQPQLPDGEESNIMGIVTVPGKHNSKVLRKKSLKRMQTASSTAT